MSEKMSNRLDKTYLVGENIILIHVLYIQSFCLISLEFRTHIEQNVEMLYNMAKILNFTYNIENPPDGKWGHIEPDGRWNGLVYHVSQDSADLIICDVFIVYGRQSVRTRNQNVICKFVKRLWEWATHKKSA